LLIAVHGGDIWQKWFRDWHVGTQY